VRGGACEKLATSCIRLVDALFLGTRLTDWFGQDLAPLASAFGPAIEDIRDRLEPVNAILAKLPFALGGKSGGESQELVAFIVGAALRFQLGDEAPRTSPVRAGRGRTPPRPSSTPRRSPGGT
jgi:hypothetical protein